MTVVGLDPGTNESALVVFDGSAIVFHGIYNNAIVIDYLEDLAAPNSTLVIEAIESYGMAVGREVFETVFWSGRFAQTWSPRPFDRLPRRVVKQHLCHTARATDSNIRQAILDRFGGSDAIGKKKTQGPLYGIKGHEFAALAVALTYYDTHKDDAELLRPGVREEF